ncbi:hypothetical protein [Ectothiorhodospira sp. BSL-9]|uniref:DUF4870 family protein n=1 Tax=Ectothiorhodospira sp. BSL-9 TaxID=1442136 RepID=UPI000B1B39BA|nr:hypothetical protein [Ectothiorhodospira sp. BSL-9]
MAEETPAPVSPNPHSDDLLMPKVVYILYILGPFVSFTGIIGVIIAYIYQGSAPDWIKTHYRFQIRTFWMGLAFLIPGILLTAVFIGWLVLLFWAIWLIVRSVKGMKTLGERQPVEHVERWSF